MGNSDLKRAYETLTAKQARYNSYWSYYDGDHVLRYSAERLNRVFKNLNTRFVQNWAAVVIDSIMDRLNLVRFDVAGNEQIETALNAAWLHTEMYLDSDDAHLGALVCGEAFVIAWRDSENELQAYYNDPRLCHVFYDPENPRRKQFAAKWWQDDDHTFLTLYYPDRLEYYHAKSTEGVNEYSKFAPTQEPEPNPFGEIPVFHLKRERRGIFSELKNVIGPQDAINKLLADMMVSAEFAAFKQRYVISNADVGQLKNAPNEVWDIPAGDGVGQATSAGEFSATDLNNFLAAMDSLAHSIAIITRTPKHYFFTQGGVPSGEALIAMEAPLNKKVSHYIERFTVPWRNLAVFMLKLLGHTVEPIDVTPVFDVTETVQPRTQAEIRQLNKNAGIPLVTSLRREGWTQAEIRQMQEDKRQAMTDAQNSLAMALVEQQRRFDKNGDRNSSEQEGNE